MSVKRKRYALITIGFGDIFHNKKYCMFEDNINEMKYANLSCNEEFFKVLEHSESEHPGRVLTDCVSFDARLNEYFDQKKVLRKMNELYLIHAYINNKELYVRFNRLSKAYRHIFERFTIEMNYGSKTLTKYGWIIKFRELLDYSSTPVAGLKTVFKSVKVLNLTITLQSYIQCKFCEHLVDRNYTKYILKEGWFCIKCTNVLEFICGNWHCDFKDIYEKHKKHNLFFCADRSICFICREAIEREPVPHYFSKHQDITYETGTSFQITKTEGRYCLLKYVDDTEHLLVCRYYFNDTEFQFVIRSPWILQEIKKFRCYITLQPINKSYEMIKYLHEFDDWKINLQKCIFENAEELLISIRLEKIM